MFVHPLIALERHEVALEPALVTEARRELLSGGEGTFRHGYLLGVHAEAGTHPACVELAAGVRERLLDDTFALSFLKLAVGTPPVSADGPFAEVPHLDSHPELSDSTELLRLLVNLSAHPRRFLYALTDPLDHPRDEFRPLRLPPGVETRVVVLPGRTETSLHALRFFASAVPHVGLNDPPEHFLLSFEAVTGRPALWTPR